MVKNNILSFILLLGSAILFIYSVYNNFKKPNIKLIDNTIVNNSLKLDSLRSKIEEDYRFKIDSISKIYNNKIFKLEQKDLQLYDKIKDFNTTIGDLPDFKE